MTAPVARRLLIALEPPFARHCGGDVFRLAFFRNALSMSFPVGGPAAPGTRPGAEESARRAPASGRRRPSPQDPQALARMSAPRLSPPARTAQTSARWLAAHRDAFVPMGHADYDD